MVPLESTPQKAAPRGPARVAAVPRYQLRGFYFDPTGGSAAKLSGANCLIRMTTTLVQKLEDLDP